MKKLTIGIPTYNRISTLINTLESVISQIECYKDVVEIFVSNNYSNDGTKEYLLSLAEKYDYITVDNLPKNLGPDGNFLNILRKANSEYIHILSDDDILVEGSLNKILEVLKDDYGLVFLNSAMFYDSYSIEKIESYKKTYSIEEDVRTVSKDEFVDIVKLEFTFLSSLVFSKKCFDQIPNPEEYLNTNWFQSYIALKSTQINKNIYIVKDVCVAQRQLTVSPSFNPFLVFGPNLEKLLMFAVECGYSNKKLKKLFYKRCLTMYRSIGKYKIDKKQLLKDFKPMFKCTFKRIRFWIFLYPWIIIPRFIFKILGKKYYKRKA